jgi:hypothetical protein
MTDDQLELLAVAVGTFPGCIIYGKNLKDRAVFFQTNYMEPLLLIAEIVLVRPEWHIQLLRFTEPEKALAFCIFSQDEWADLSVGDLASEIALAGTNYKGALELRNVNERLLRQKPASGAVN